MKQVVIFMDTEISGSEQKKASIKKVVIWLAVIGFLVLAVILLRGFLKKSVERQSIQIATVTRGPIANTITASGTIVPSFEMQINSPINTEIKEVLVPTGSKVEPGDILLKLDPSIIQITYDQTKDELEVRRNNVQRSKLEYDKNVNELSLDDQIKNLQLASLESQLADQKRLREIGGATEEEVRQAELDLKIQQLEKKKLENELSFRRQSLASDKRNLELEVMIQEKNLKELALKLNKTSVVSPGVGVITWINEDIGKQVVEGDALVRIANLKSFKIEGAFSDRYMQRIQVGDMVTARINDTKLPGSIAAILPEIENNSVKCIILLEDDTDPRLRPNMRVELQVITEQRNDALQVINGAVFTGAKQQELFVVRGQQAIKTTVNLGISNIDYIEIVSGLQEGDQIIISDTRAFQNSQSIEINE